MYMLCVWGYACECRPPWRLYVVTEAVSRLVWLGTKLRPSARVVRFLCHSTISPARDFLRRTLSPTVLYFRENMNMPRNYSQKKNPCVFWLRLLEYYSILKLLDLLVSQTSRTIIFHACTPIKWDLKISPLSRTRGNPLNVYSFLCVSQYIWIQNCRWTSSH